jgi:dolichol-phosphate mannosyltransferase
MDADFSHDPRYLPALLTASAGADVVLGSRYVAGGGVRDWSLIRKLVSRGGGVYARAVLGVKVNDLTGGFKCIRREVLEAIDLPSVRADGYVFQIEVTYRAILAGFTVREIPIVFADRVAGKSKMSARIALEAVWRVPALKREARPALARAHSAVGDGLPES